MLKVSMSCVTQYGVPPPLAVSCGAVEYSNRDICSVPILVCFYTSQPLLNILILYFIFNLIVPSQFAFLFYYIYFYPFLFLVYISFLFILYAISILSANLLFDNFSPPRLSWTKLTINSSIKSINPEIARKSFSSHEWLKITMCLVNTYMYTCICTCMGIEDMTYFRYEEVKTQEY